MRLVKIEFQKFRSIVGEDLDIEPGITCLVGVNESGKSNVLFALEKADEEEELDESDFSRHDEDFGNGKGMPALRLWFVPSTTEEKAALEELFGKKFNHILLEKSGGDYTLSYPAIDYEKSTFGEEEEDEEETEGEAPADEEDEESSETEELSDEQKREIRDGVVKELVESYLPRFLRFDSVDFEEYFLPLSGEVEITKLIATPDEMRPVKNLLNLGGITDLNLLVASNEKERIRRDKLLGDASNQINEKTLKVVWPIQTVRVCLDAEGDILKIQLREEGKTSPFTPGERSRGLQWALAFNVYFLAETSGDLQNSVLLIDEPGVFLHVDGQKKLLEQTFPQIVEGGNQVIYTTHLPYLINPEFPERIRILSKEKEDTLIGNKAWSEGEFGLLPEPVKTALGLKWSEILHFGDTNVLVEGPSDQIIFRELHALLGGQPDIHFLPAYGGTKVPLPLALIRVEQKQGFAIIDADADLEKIRERAKTVNIPPDDIENICEVSGAKDVLTTEDIIPEDVYKELVYRVYAPICERRKDCEELQRDEIPTALPRVSTTEDFFKERFGAEKHKLLKMEIARAFQEYLRENPTKATTDKWKAAKATIKWIDNKVKKIASEEGASEATE